MILNRLPAGPLFRGAAVAAALAGSVLTGGVASAANAPILDSQMTSHVGPTGMVEFQLQYSGPDSVADIAVVPTDPAAALSVRVLGPNGLPVELYPTQDGPGINNVMVGQDAGTYTVEVTNQGDATNVAITVDQTPLAAPTNDNGSDSTDSGTTASDDSNS